MKWNNESGIVRYQMAYRNVTSILGINTIDIYNRPELLPYITTILEYLSERLILNGIDSEIKEKVQLIFDIFDFGADLICTEKVIDLAFTIKLSTEIGETEDLNYDQDRFVFSWSNLMTALCVRLKFQYGYLFSPSYSSDCCNCGSKGQTTTEYESWRSGIYPEDELYDRSVLYNNHTAWGTNNPNDVDCSCMK